jgi:hypothetical protein
MGIYLDFRSVVDQATGRSGNSKNVHRHDFVHRCTFRWFFYRTISMLLLAETAFPRTGSRPSWRASERGHRESTTFKSHQSESFQLANTRLNE